MLSVFLAFSQFFLNVKDVKASVNSGYYNDQITWEYDSSLSMFTVKGNGALEGGWWYFSDGSPFNGYPEGTNLVISEGITKIGDNEFAGYMWERVSLPNSLVEIGDYAFADCEELSSIIVPDSVISIGMNAFKGMDIVYAYSTHPLLKDNGFAYGASRVVIIDNNTDPNQYTGNQYAVLQDDGSLVFFRSNYTYTNKKVGTFFDNNGNRYKGIIYCDFTNKTSLTYEYDPSSPFTHWGTGQGIKYLNNSPWKDEKDQIIKAYVADNNTISVTSTCGWFIECTNLKYFSARGIDTSSLTHTNFMFYKCVSLNECDLNGFSTNKVAYMNGMFYNCSSLSELDISSFNTSNITKDNMKYIFNGANSLYKVTLGEGFTYWENTGKLPSGSWHNGDLVKTETELYSLYPANSEEWAGTWERPHIELPNQITMFVGTTIDLRSLIENRYTTTTHYAYSIGDNSIISLDGWSIVAQTAGDTTFTLWSNDDDSVVQVTMNVTVVDSLTAPTVTTAKNYGNGILVEWNEVPGATGYVIYRRAWNTSAGDWTTFARWNNTKDLSFLDTKVYVGTKYQYGIKAYYGDDPTTTTKLGPVGPMSTALIYAKKPDKTTITTTENVHNGIKIEWEPVKGATGYVIYRRAWSSTTNGWTTFERWNNTTNTSWVDTKVYAGTRYQYGIKAYYGDNPKNMAYVGEVGPLKTNVRITTRKLLAAAPSERGSNYKWTLKIKWDASSVFTGYQIKYLLHEINEYDGPVEKIVTISNPKTSTYTINAGEYMWCDVCVRSYHIFNEVTYYGEWSPIDTFWPIGEDYDF